MSEEPMPARPLPDPTISDAAQAQRPLAEPPIAPSAAETVTISIGDEFGSARRKLPPAGIVLICLVAVSLVVGMFAFRGRAKPQGGGAIQLVAAVDVPGQNAVLAAITLSLRNATKQPLWIKTLTAHLTTADGQTWVDDAASAVDLDRYYQGFPALKEGSEPPLSRETKLAAGAEQRGTIIVGFKVTRKEFEQRKGLTVVIQPYDQALPVVLK